MLESNLENTQKDFQKDEIVPHMSVHMVAISDLFWKYHPHHNFLLVILLTNRKKKTLLKITLDHSFASDPTSANAPDSTVTMYFELTILNDSWFFAHTLKINVAPSCPLRHLFGHAGNNCCN